MVLMETAFGTLARRRNAFEDRRIADRQYSDSLLEEALSWEQEDVVEDTEELLGKHIDSNGTTLENGDTVTLIKALVVKGGGFTVKRAMAVCGIRLVADNPQHIEGRVEGQRIVILTEFVKKN